MESEEPTEFVPSEPIGKSDNPDSPISENDPSTEDNSSVLLATCTYRGESYAAGAIVCMGGNQYKCNGRNGEWVNTRLPCRG